MRILIKMIFLVSLFTFCNIRSSQIDTELLMLLNVKSVKYGGQNWNFISNEAEILDYDIWHFSENEFNHELKYYLPNKETIKYYIDSEYLTIQRYMEVKDSCQEFLPFVIEKDNNIYISQPLIIKDVDNDDSISGNNCGSSSYIVSTIRCPLPDNYKNKRFIFINREINILKRQIKTYNNETIKEVFSNFSCDEYHDLEIYLRAFKHEKVLELWMKGGNADKFNHIKDYEFCAFIGELGPKRKENDVQIPEGFYNTNRYRPYSNYVSTIGFNYPNMADSILGDPTLPDKFMAIHGTCVTLGCISIQDSSMSELFNIVMCAKKSGQNDIPVHIFPCKMDEEGMDILKNYISDTSSHMPFWLNIKEGYDYFERNKRLPKITVNIKGEYLFNEY